MKLTKAQMAALVEALEWCERKAPWWDDNDQADTRKLFGKLRRAATPGPRKTENA